MVVPGLFVRVWNEAVAHRLSTMGHCVRQGDLVWMQTGQHRTEDTGGTSSPQVKTKASTKSHPVLFYYQDSCLICIHYIAQYFNLSHYSLAQLLFYVLSLDN